jgi:hypothetical protein
VSRFIQCFNFGSLYHPGNGRSGTPTRLIVGLHYLKHTFNQSDEAVDSKTVVIGEAGLGGEVRSDQQIKVRVNEAAKFGFKRAVIPKSRVEMMGVRRISFRALQQHDADEGASPPQQGSPPLIFEPKMAEAQPTPLSTIIASVGQFFWHAPHSMQAD